VLQLPQSTVSRHLKVLADEGWVGSRAQGTTRLYRMAETEAGARRLWALSKEQTNGWATTEHDQARLRRRLAARQPEAQAFFAGAAGEWDRLRGELYGQGFTQAALLSLVPPEWTVADLGCGTGQVAAALAPHVRRVIGVDQSAAMLKAARRRTAGCSNVELHQGRLEALPLEDESVDAALLLLALTYVEEPLAALGEARRVLRRHGRVVVVDLLRHDREEFRRQLGQSSLGFEPAALQGLAAEAGLEPAAARVLPPEAQAKGPALLLMSARRPGVSVSSELKEKESA
jgi:ArsR family transcriptional regulator